MHPSAMAVWGDNADSEVFVSDAKVHGPQRQWPEAREARTLSR